MTKQPVSKEYYQTVLETAELLHDADTIEHAIAGMARDINNKLHGSNPIILPVMLGGLVLAGKLIPKFNFSLEIDYIHVTRYHGEIKGGELHWLRKPEKSLRDKTVLLIDDLLDKGLTLSAIINYGYEAGASEILTAVLAEKETIREKTIQHANFTGLNVPDRYVFGYGMDYHESHRNLNGIYAVRES